MSDTVPVGQVYLNAEKIGVGCQPTAQLHVVYVIFVKILTSIAPLGPDRVNATKTNNTWIYTAKR